MIYGSVKNIQLMYIDKEVLRQRCDELKRDVTYRAVACFIGDSPEESYAFSHPCIENIYRTVGDTANCKKAVCKDHWIKLLALAKAGRIDVLPDVKYLKRGETNIAHLSEDLYWGFVKNRKDAKELRRSYFTDKISALGRKLEERIELDIETPQETKHRLARELSKTGDIRIDGKKLGKEIEKYSLASNIGEMIEELGFVESMDVSPRQINHGDDLIWLLTGDTRWDRDKYIVIQIEKNELENKISEMQYSSYIVSLKKDLSGIGSVEKTETVISAKPVSSHSRTFVDIGLALDELKVRDCTGALA